MASGLVSHNVTTATAVTFGVKSWVSDTGSPDVGAVPVAILTDGTSVAAVKAASAAPTEADPALVVAISPNSAGLQDTGQAPMASSPSVCIASDQTSIAIKPSSNTTDWTYAAAASGISNTTTAVTIRAASAGLLRNAITAIDVSSTALSAATELVIRNGAAGTVLWRMTISTAGLINGFSKTFPTPIAGSANTLLEVATLTAATGSVYVNAQGIVTL